VVLAIPIHIADFRARMTARATPIRPLVVARAPSSSTRTFFRLTTTSRCSTWGIIVVTGDWTTVRSPSTKAVHAGESRDGRPQRCPCLDEAPPQTAEL
jgi:hypothetical protein